MQVKVAPMIACCFLLRSRCLFTLLRFVKRAKQTKNIHISTKKEHSQKFFMWTQEENKV